MNADIYLKTYLNDHLAGSVGGLELAKRCYRENRASSLGCYLQKLIKEIEEDQNIVKELLLILHAPYSHWKIAAAWIMEKAGRFTFNGHFFSYSPLSRVLELEALLGGSQARKELWQALSLAHEDDKRFEGYAFKALEKKAAQQMAKLSQLHRSASREIFGKRAQRAQQARM